jgi:hypothetical protein
MKFFLIIVSVLISSLTFAQDPQMSYVAPTKLLRAKGYQLGVYADSFKTSKFVDQDGKASALPNGSSFGRMQSEFAGYYGATNDLQFGAGVRFRQNRATFEETGESKTATGTGLQSTFFNIAFAFQQVDQLQYTLEGTFRYTPYTNQDFDAAIDDPLVLVLGDTGNEISAGLGMTYLGRNNKFFTMRGGYRRPGADLSHELYWQAEGALSWRYIALIAGVDGVSSLKNDPYQDSPSERPILNARTNLYGSQNREWINPYVGLNLALGDTWRIEIRGAQVVSGVSTDLGTTLGVNLIRRVDKSSTRFVDNKFKTYDIEATVTKVSPQKEYVEIDKGIADDLHKGMKIDLFEFDYVGGNILVASGVVVKTKSDSSIVKISQRYNMKKEIKEGLIARTTLK